MKPEEIKLYFGKYYGKSVLDVIDIDPCYLIWVSGNVKTIKGLNVHLMYYISDNIEFIKGKCYKK